MAMATAHTTTKPAIKAPARWQDYVQLLKPRVMSLVVFTGLTGLVCAGQPVHPVLGAVAILCIAVGAGASGALNMGYDADIDAKMRRTRGRPVPAGRLQGRDAPALGGGGLPAPRDPDVRLAVGAALPAARLYRPGRPRLPGRSRGGGPGVPAAGRAAGPQPCRRRRGPAQ